MNPFDMAVAIICGYCIIMGIFRGFIREAASIAGVVGGFYAAGSNYALLVPFVEKWMANPAYVKITCFILVFSAVFMLAAGAGFLCRTLLKAALLGFVDRILGAVFGAVKGIAILTILLFLLTTFLPRADLKIIRDSKTAPAVERAASLIMEFVPEKAKARFKARIHSLKSGDKTGEKGPETGKGKNSPGKNMTDL